MKRIYVARHGQSTWNRDRRWAGHADPPLTDFGRLQARESCLTLGKFSFTSVSSSRLQRAIETASIIAEEMGIELLGPVDDLNERHYGELSGLTSEEIKERYPGFIREWEAGKPAEIPGGEPWRHFVERVSRGLRYLSTLPGCLLFIAHMGVLRAVEYSLGVAPKRHGNLEGMWVEVDPEGAILDSVHQ